MKTLDLSFRNNEKPTRGCLLVSDPFLHDAYFTRSVVLLCENNKDGAFGFVLNNYLEIDLHDFDSSFPDIDARVGLGGPVAKESLFFIHKFEPGEVNGSTQIQKGLYYGGDYEQICSLLKWEKNHDKVRFFIGYSGWSPKQLDEEIESDAWIPIHNHTAEMIFNTANTNLWKECLEMQGEKFKFIANFPRKPSDN